MRRWIVLVAIGALLAVPVASGAEWLRSGYDPGRTGAIPFEGPQTNDTAFQVQLPGTPWRDVVIAEDAAFVATIDDGHENLSAEALWRIDLDTGATERLFNLSEDAFPVKITPEVLYVGEYEIKEKGPRGEFTGELVAYEVPTGEELWRLDPRPTQPIGEVFYEAVQVRSTLFVSLGTYPQAGMSPNPISTEGFAIAPQTQVGVMAVDLETHEDVWIWDQPVDKATVAGNEIPLPDATSSPERRSYVGGIAADDDRVYVYLTHQNQANSRIRSQFELQILDATDGSAMWSRNDTQRTGPIDGFGRLVGATPVVTDTDVRTRLDAYNAFNQATGEELWESEAGRSDHWDVQGAYAMGATDEAFIATTPQSVYRFDLGSGEIDWQQTDTDTNRGYGLRSMGIDEDTVYVPTFYDVCGPTGYGYEARDLSTGELLWDWHYSPTVGEDDCNVSIPSFPAVGPGVIVVAAKDGMVNVVGQTQASIGPPKVPAERYPAEGEDVSVTLSDTDPGAFGNATRYRVDWGDGTASGWQTSPVFSHAYENGTGTVEARLQVANDANQTSSTFVTMHVGQGAPTEPNVIETAFQKENQDLTFGVLGLLVAFTGGAIGVGRRYRKRSLLQDELEAMEHGVEELQDRPSECEAFLDTRKARARSLAIDGKLEEQQVTVLESRAEELRGSLRLEALQEEFAFLPHGLVTKARQMVTDGDVSALEREAFLAALEEDEMLTEAQRATVRERIERWYARDGGGGAGA